MEKSKGRPGTLQVTPKVLFRRRSQSARLRISLALTMYISGWTLMPGPLGDKTSPRWFGIESSSFNARWKEAGEGGVSGS